MDDIFDNYFIVDEKSLTFNTNATSFNEVSQFAALDLVVSPHSGSFNSLQVKDIGTVCQSANNVPLAQIISLGWNEKGEQVIKETEILNTGEEIRFYVHPSSVIVFRIVKKREKSENPCKPLNSDDDLTVHIGDKKITLSAAWLMSVSPVIHRMLSVEMKEKQQRSLTLDELGVDMELFIEFLENISTIALHKPILPNPKNVLMLLKLADFFQVDWLRSRCESHLINCMEIPLIDRFLLIDRYQLDNLKNFFLNLGVVNLRAFYKTNREQLLPDGAVVSKLLGELIICLCG